MHGVQGTVSQSKTSFSDTLHSMHASASNMALGMAPPHELLFLAQIQTISPNSLVNIDSDEVRPGSESPSNQLSALNMA